jgi:hypothetical protein
MYFRIGKTSVRYLAIWTAVDCNNHVLINITFRGTENWKIMLIKDVPPAEL